MDKFDENKKCLKCGSSANTKYNKNLDVMVRTCILCGFVWEEEPLNSKKNRNESTKEDQKLLLEGD